VLVQICADIVFLSLLLFFSGGATNAFVSLLLIPIAIAAVTLSPILLALVAILAITSYSILLWFLPMSVMHGNMQGHFIGMGINFLFSTLVVALVVGKMARSINRQELAIAAYRENLLKQEQVTSLGVASAQVTHQLATPIATVQLLTEELSDDFPDTFFYGYQGLCNDSSLLHFYFSLYLPGISTALPKNWPVESSPTSSFVKTTIRPFTNIV
jgi:two-component system sensor histidine kinase RegB